MVLCSLTATAQTITMFAGTLSDCGFGGDGAPATNAQLCHVTSMRTNSTGSVFFCNDGREIREVTPDGILHTPAFNSLFSTFFHIKDFVIDGADNIYVFSEDSACVYKITPSGVMSSYAGISGNLATSIPDGSVAISTPIMYASCMAIDRFGNIFLASGGAFVHKITPAGLIYRVAGDGVFGGYSGDNGPATLAQFMNITTMACDSAGNLFIADFDNNRVRKVDLNTSIVTTYFQTNTGFTGDGGPATAAGYGYVYTLSARGNDLYIADEAARVRRINATGIINTVAGTGILGFSGNGGPALAANIVAAYLHIQPSGTIYIGQSSTYTIRKVTGDYLLGVNNHLATSIKIYPNPSNGKLIVELPASSSEVNITVTDMVGRVIISRSYEPGIKEIFIENSELKEGNYIIATVSKEFANTQLLTIVK